MAEIVNKAYEIIDVMKERGYFPEEHLENAKEVISSYPVSKVREKHEKAPYRYVAASLWLTGYFMGEQYRRTYWQILIPVMERKLGVFILQRSVSKIAKDLIKDPNVKETLRKIHESYGKPEIPPGLIISELYDEFSSA